MINIAIVDDQKESRDLIVQTLNNSEQLTDLDYKYVTYKSGEAFLECKDNTNYDILILDIEMPGINGVDLAKKLKHTHNNLIIVFLTSYEHHMKDAFGLNVHSYIIKETMINELPNVVRDLIIDKSKSKIKLRFNTNHGTVDIYEDDIVCIVFENRSPVIYTKKLSLTVYGESLYKVYERLSVDNYLQPNSGTIVNVRYIKHIRNNVLYMKYFDTPITISRSRLKAVKQKHIEFLVVGESL